MIVAAATSGLWCPLVSIAVVAQLQRPTMLYRTIGRGEYERCQSGKFIDYTDHYHYHHHEPSLETHPVGARLTHIIASAGNDSVAGRRAQAGLVSATFASSDTH